MGGKELSLQKKPDLESLASFRDVASESIAGKCTEGEQEKKFLGDI